MTLLLQQVSVAGLALGVISCVIGVHMHAGRGVVLGGFHRTLRRALIGVGLFVAIVSLAGIFLTGVPVAIIESSRKDVFQNARASLGHLSYGRNGRSQSLTAENILTGEPMISLPVESSSSFQPQMHKPRATAKKASLILPFSFSGKIM